MDISGILLILFAITYENRCLERFYVKLFFNENIAYFHVNTIITAKFLLDFKY